ncbi:hypothetical protein [Paraburkholderia ginsengisoli]|uniref:Uncharacterized protein n=1 Tax=Paraburkholderia ginsengisoli TaxID=311231 RepID=A0A7T4N446_9BURK|nr:hypothetical protein [Paraburkholderia ginsengisoli]QQC64881.1 hypothetical protein I6I06_05235 [Paraburkholderia ginsengisoli]
MSQTIDALAQHIEGLTPETHDYVRMRALCEAMGYTDYRVFPSGRRACIRQLGHAAAILADITPDGGGELWCYATAAHAREALVTWGGPQRASRKAGSITPPQAGNGRTATRQRNISSPERWL